MKSVQKLIKPIILCLCLVVIGYALYARGYTRKKLVYADHLSDTAVTVDGQAITFKDLAFYILYEEGAVEEQARIYNTDSTKDFWNLHTNGSFISAEAKDCVMDMAIHDYIFYQLAVSEGMDQLTSDEKQQLEYAKSDFWEDLLDIQWEKLPCDEATINDQIALAAVAEKYGNYLAEKDGPSQAAYKYDGYYYEQIKNQHHIVINDKLWDRFVMGDNTLKHSNVNYINGLRDEEKKEK